MTPAKSPGQRAAAVTSPLLTPREIDVFGMMADGLGNKLIAARLAISLHTVTFPVAAIFAKRAMREAARRSPASVSGRARS